MVFYLTSPPTQDRLSGAPLCTPSIMLIGRFELDGGFWKFGEDIKNSAGWESCCDVTSEFPGVEGADLLLVIPPCRRGGDFVLLGELLGVDCGEVWWFYNRFTIS